MAHPRHEEVRQRFAFRCGYCGVSETDTGGQLTVDHFHPVHARGDDSDDNLIYACPRCNLRKSDSITGIDPASEEQVSLFHPRNATLLYIFEEDFYRMFP